ncbi:hypothetical protein NDU88_004188 [Pleurodeles waltl]|uniref:Uncharacterized protein n=1 Tax=Pleurodeles waltl TaxID=8319 RepID=A0AAV7QER3_PLEWA|nr:hypothetical protein NDU88_004188 [Pleurodeles waltl]
MGIDQDTSWLDYRIGRLSLATILYIKDARGDGVSSRDEIFADFAEYLRVLYSAGTPGLERYLKDFERGAGLPRLCPEQRQGLEEDISLQDLEEASKAMKKAKGLGEDGFPVELYKTVKGTLLPMLLEVFMEARDRGTLLASMREGLVCLMQKPGLLSYAGWTTGLIDLGEMT